MVSRGQQTVRERKQPFVGLCARGGRVDACANAGLAVGRFVEPEQAFAFDIGAYADRGQRCHKPFRQPGLARTRQPAHDRERWPALGRLAACQRGIVARLRDIGDALVFRLALAAANRRHLGAHQAAIHEIEIEQHGALVIAAAFEIAVEEMRGQLGVVFLREVHDQETDIGEDIGIAQVGIEFDAVERGYPGRQAHEIAEMQVAVAVAHEAVVEPLPQRRRVLFELVFRPVSQEAKLVLAQDIAEVIEVFPEIVHGLPEEALPVGGVRAFGGGMACRDAFTQLLHVRDREQPVGELPVETQVLVETQHLHRVFECFAVAADDGFVRRLGNRNDLQVQFRPPRSVQAQLLLAEVQALFQRAEIKEVEHDRFLDFVGIVAREDDPGDVRLHEFDVVRRVRKRFRAQQRFDQAGIRAVECAVWHCPLPTG